jgi:hypothetical protein
MVRKERRISSRKMLIAFETVMHVVQINPFIKKGEIFLLRLNHLKF